MVRLILPLMVFPLVAGACGQTGGGPPDPATEDQFYSLFLNEVLERGEEWWGYPPPTHYCIAIALNRGEPPLIGSRDPSQEVLHSLGQANPDRIFHPASSCGDEFPVEAPTGEAAGLLWVAPLESTDRVTLPGGWTAERDMTHWGCSFLERGGVVELQECTKWSET